MKNSILNHYLFDAFSVASDNMFVYVTDIRNDLTRWSQKAVEYFDLEGEYIYDVKTKWIDYIYPDDREEYKEDLIATITGRKQMHNVQYRARNKYGEYVWVECRGSVIKNENGEPIVFAGIMTRLDNQNKYDNLTKLPTVYEFQQLDFDTVEGSLMLVGIDGFRKINNRKGVLYGNQVLILFAKLIELCVSKDCRVYHYQSDEFLVYAQNTNADKMKEFFEHLTVLCAKGDREHGINGFSISGGVVQIEKGSTAFMEVATKVVNAISAAKESQTHFVCYSREIEEKQNRKNMVAEALNDSIRNDFKGFELFYQPIMAKNGERLIGCESLLRWNPDHPEIGNCYPNEFIPILENNGGIVEVGYFVMREAIRQASEWQSRGIDIRVSFNVSYLQFEDRNFINALIATAEHYHADTSRIIVELTESVFASDTVMIRKSFELLHQHGFMIALDDFGTGHSSFWMLHNLDVDIIKLDQTFIRGLGKDDDTEVDLAIVRSVAVLCETLDYLTIVEGVEDEYVINTISEYNFTGMQGYHFSKPVPKKRFEEYISQYC